jgi:hypothetical protein
MNMKRQTSRRIEYTPFSLEDHRRMAFLLRRMRRDLFEIAEKVYATGAPKKYVRRILGPLSKADVGLAGARCRLEDWMCFEYPADSHLNYYFGRFPSENAEEEAVKEW